MPRLRGEELPGFLDVLQTWLPHQLWFPAQAGRWSLARVGGLRLTAPEGDTDPGLFLELHVFAVRGLDGGEQRISVPLTLRSRPSALAGKDALVGRLSHEELGEIWLYDGTRDRAFLAAWLEMARREQGTRNGRARGEAYSGFSQRKPFTVRLRRSCRDTEHITRALVTPEDVEDTAWGCRVVIDFLRRPEPGSPEAYDVLEALATARARCVPDLLGVVWGAWEQAGDADSGATGQTGAEQESIWDYGDLALIREGALVAPDAETVAVEVAAAGYGFTGEARGIGRALADVHADFAAAFGAYPQTALQAEEASEEALVALEDAWKAVIEADGFSHEERQRMESHVGSLRSCLDAAAEPMTLQTIHGALSLTSFRRPEEHRGWIVDDAGGVQEHGLPLTDAAAVVAVLAETAGDQRAFDVPAVTGAFLQGLAEGDSDTSWTSSALFRTQAVLRLLQLRGAARLSQGDLDQVCAVLFDSAESA